MDAVPKNKEALVEDDILRQHHLLKNTYNKIIGQIKHFTMGCTEGTNQIVRLVAMKNKA